MKRHQALQLAGLALCTGSLWSTAHAAPSSKFTKKEQNVSAFGLHVGDAIYAIHAAKHDVVFDGTATAKVACLSPLTLNLNGTSNQPVSGKIPLGDFGVAAGTKRKAGTLYVVTITKPNQVKFTRLKN